MHYIGSWCDKKKIKRSTKPQHKNGRPGDWLNWHSVNGVGHFGLNKVKLRSSVEHG